MSTIQSITLGVQQQVPGIVIPVTVTVSGSAPTYLTAQFRDVIHNTAESACQKITNFTEGATVDGVTTFTATLEMSETTASQIFGTDFTPEIQVTVFRGTVHSNALSGLYWFSPMQNVTYTAAPGGEKITLYIEADENYINDANLANLIAQVTYAANGASSVTRSVDVTSVEGNNHRWTAVLDNLNNGVEYELNVGLENDFGVGNSDTTISEMPSFNPSTVSIESFDSLDPSGGRFTFKCAAFDYSDYTQLNLKIKLTQGSIVEEASIDICGNSFMPTINEFSIVEYLKEESSEIVSGQFKVEAFIQGEIAIDVCGNELRTYNGAKASRNYIQDVNMSNPVVTLSEIDWVSGTQTVKAVVDGSFANVTFVFDLSGSVASTTQYDICNNQMIATQEYSYATLNNYDGVRVSVSASRPELNGGVTPSVTDEVEMNFDLMAIKRAPAPEVEIDLLYGNVGGATLTFANIDASFTSLLGVISQGEDEIVSDIDADASGAVMELSSESLVPGTRYLVSGYSRLHLTDAGYAARYSELNENADHLRSIATSSQYVYSGTPTIYLSYRPRDASTNIIDTVRLEGDKSANNVNQLMALARDVSGQVQQATLTVGPETTDSCGNRLFHAALVDRAGNYTHDFTFTKALDLEETRFAFGLLDTPTALDATTTIVTNIQDALDFVSTASAYNTALSEYTVALDLSSNPTKDETYQGYVTAIANYDISINDLSNAILAHTIVRDGSNSGSLWFKEQKTELYDLALSAYSVAVYNTVAVSAAYQALLTALSEATPAEDVEIQLTEQEVTLQFLDEANDVSYQTITVSKYPTTDAYYNAQSALEHELALKQAAQTASLASKNSASDAKDAAVDAHNNTVDAISTKSGLKTTAINDRTTAVTARTARQVALASDAADKKVTLYGANGTGGVAKDLRDARLPFLA